MSSSTRRLVPNLRNVLRTGTALTMLLMAGCGEDDGMRMPPNSPTPLPAPRDGERLPDAIRFAAIGGAIGMGAGIAIDVARSSRPMVRLTVAF